MTFEYYYIQAEESDEPGIDGGIGEIKDVSFGGGKPLCVVTIPVINFESIANVKGLIFGMVQPEPKLNDLNM
jgi:hypothetical protein